MTAERGGRAEKLGNRYERWWVARQLLDVLRGEAVSVTLEALGDDEVGVDLWVEQRDGTRHAQQCKRANSSKGKWSIADLASRGVLRHLRDQLDRSPSHRFTFVSRDPTPGLDALSERARSAGNDPGAYWTHQVNPYSEHRTAFCQFCGYLDLEPENLNDRVRAFDLLRRTSVHVVRDDSQGLNDLTLMCNAFVAGDRNAVVRSLASLAEDNLARPLHVDTIREHLVQEQLRPRDLSLDPNLPARIEQLNDEFRESLTPWLIAGQLIHRTVTEQIAQALKDESGARLIVLHGRAGNGKSAVLLEVAKLLQDEACPFLGLRLDRRPPAVSASSYGKEVCGLPESPVICLNAVAGWRPAVLILDQLDAIRWTSAHATGGWESCLEVIRQGLSTSNVRVVVACRTFDLREDPQLSAWHREAKGREIEVGELPEQEVQRVVTALRADFKALTPPQKRLLTSPQNLALWSQLQTDGTTTADFRTSTDLMRQYWRNRRERFVTEGASAEECERALSALTEAMDRQGRLYASATLLDPFPGAQRALCSLNVVSVVRGRVSFAHQSYFDYVLAERLARDVVLRRQRVVDWVRDSEQSLFRREQLRTLLTLLRDDDPTQHGTTLRALLAEPDIRFHLKHLVLQFLAQCDPPTAEEKRLMLELLKEDAWLEQILQYVVRGQPHWFDVLCEAEVIQSWLGSDQEGEINRALGLIQWVSHRRGDALCRVLGAYVDQGDPWPKRVALALWCDPADDSDTAFELRVRLVRSGAAAAHFPLCNWSKLAQEQPLRAIRLLETQLQWVAAEIEGYETEPDCERKERPFGKLAGPLEERVSEAAVRQPIEALDRLLPMVEKIEQLYRQLAERSEARDQEGFWTEEEFRPTSAISAVVMKTLIAAFLSLSEVNSPEFERRFGQFAESQHRFAQAVLLRVLGRVPERLADFALTWLCSRPGQFADGDRFDRAPWATTRAIIERLASACSDGAFRGLEDAILAYHHEREWRSIRHRREWHAEQYCDVPNEYGCAQHALLSILPASRMSDRARNQLGQLERKLGQYDPSQDHRTGTLVGCVHSPLRAGVAAKLSDDAWLKIINSTLPKKNRRPHRMDDFTEASHGEFSRDFGAQSKLQPRRFAQLALKIPRDAFPGYMAAALEALQLTDPPKTDEARQDAEWAPATGEDIEAVLRHVGYTDERAQALSFCRLIKARADCRWSEETLQRLIEYATQHPDPRPGEYAVQTWTKSENGSNVGVPDVVGSSLNCVRASAADSITRLLFDHPELFARLEPAVLKLVEDPHVVVRAAAVGPCLPMLNFNRDNAVHLVLTACDVSDDRILESRYLDKFLAYACHTHLEKLRPLLTRMRRCHLDDVAKLGAGRTAGIYVQSGDLADAVEEDLTETIAQRLGVAYVAGHWLHDEQVRPACSKLLIRLFSDEHVDVRKAAAQFLNLDNVVELLDGTDVLREFAERPVLIDATDKFFRAMKEHRGSLLMHAGALLSACSGIAKAAAGRHEQNGPQFGWEFHYVPGVLLRLYEQAEQAGDGDVRRRCLDAWDAFLAAGADVTRELLSGIDG
jgi:hypothetical protein